MKTEKTVKEWLNELPLEHRSKAITNLNIYNAGQEGDEALTESLTRPSQIAALYSAFEWEHTPEGFEYWSRVASFSYKK